VFVTAVAWPWAAMTSTRFGNLVRNYADWHVANSAPGNPNTSLNALMFLTHQSNGQLSMIVQSDATQPGAERLLDDFLTTINNGVGVQHEPVTTQQGEFGRMPDLVTPRRLPWLQATRLLGTTDGRLNDPSMRMDYKSTYMRRSFPERQIATLFKYLTSTEINNPSVVTQLHAYGGQVNAVAPDPVALRQTQQQLGLSTGDVEHPRPRRQIEERHQLVQLGEAQRIADDVIAVADVEELPSVHDRILCSAGTLANSPPGRQDAKSR